MNFGYIINMGGYTRFAITDSKKSLVYAYDRPSTNSKSKEDTKRDLTKEFKVCNWRVKSNID